MIYAWSLVSLPNKRGNAMKTKIKSRKGFSLVELMVAIVAGLIVVLAAGIVIYLGQISWNDAWNKVNLQRDASYAMLAMSQYVKKAASATADANDPILTLVVDDNDVVFSYDADANDLLCEVGGNTQNILDGKVKDLDFFMYKNPDDNADGDGDPNSPPPNSVKIRLKLQEDNVEAQFESTVMMRNTGG